MPFLPVFWHILQPRERYYPKLLQQMKPELETKGNPWNGATIFPEEKIQRVSVSMQVRITVFWDCEGGVLVDVMPTGKTIIFNAYITTQAELRKCFN
jgi:hypothetical protein